MSDAITMTLRQRLDERVELDGVTPDRLASLDEREIASLPVRVGRREVRLGELFDVRGGRSARVRVAGDLHQVDGLGAATSAGEMIVEGDVGDRLAAGMTGGWIDTRGSAGDAAGLAMAGGALRIVGNAGERVGAGAPGASRGMAGGEIVVNGNVGGGAAARLRRGLVVVTGTAGTDAGRAMNAGTFVAFGAVAAPSGRGSKRGSIVALDAIEIPETYTYACTFQPTYIRLLLTYLRRRYGVAVDDDALNGRFLRYCGDAATVGKGEILQLLR
jgi:formylmethanofuran dehydrogenase subunit C